VITELLAAYRKFLVTASTGKDRYLMDHLKRASNSARSLAAALQHLIDAAAAGWPLLAEAFCRSVTGHACAPPVYRNTTFEVPLAAAATVGASRGLAPA
jgi:hypothetical protein